MKTIGLSDVIGPIMVGPSSSHTAGALRIAYMARRLCLAEPKTVEFRLLGSFAHTLTGHGTDKALVAGMLGLAADDLRIRDSFQLAGDAGLAFSFVTLPDEEYDHPNTIDMRIVDAAGNAMSVRGESIGGGAAVIRKIDDIDVRITGESTSIVVRQRDETGVLAHIAQSISDEGVNIATTRMYRERKGDIAYTVLETDQEVDGAAKAAIGNYTKYMAAELAMKFSPEMRVNAIVPGFLLTNQNRTLLTNPDGSYTDRARTIIAHTPGRPFRRTRRTAGHDPLPDQRRFVVRDGRPGSR